MKRTIPIQTFRAEAFPVRVGHGCPAEKHQGKGQRIPRIKTCCCVLATIPLLVACASPPLALAPVGPGPFAPAVAGRQAGGLQVYTEPEEYYEDDLRYFPHTDYQLYTSDGEHLRRVWNHNTHEDEIPALVSLASGQYIVQAWAESYGLVSVPVVIKANELTKVILQPGWDPGANIARSELVQMPKGYFVGWRAELAGAK